MDDRNSCLNCRLPECNENDPRCRLVKVRRRATWQGEIDQVACLWLGEWTEFSYLTLAQVRRLKAALDQAARRGKLQGPLAMRSFPEEGLDTYRLEVRRGRPDGVHRWTRWAEELQRIRGLQPGEECAFPVATEQQLRNLRSCALQLKRSCDIRVTTHKTKDPLALHVRRME